MKARFLYRAFKARYRDQRQEIQAVISSLQAGDIAVDVGANKGAYLYWLRKAVGSRGKLFAYEPQPRLAQYLRSVCSGMKWRNVSVRQCAISDSAGTQTLHVPGAGESPGASLEDAVLAASTGRSYQCRVDTLDSQLEGVGRIAFLKVDVEGHELCVFRGAEKVLGGSAPVILFECEQRHLTKHSMEDVFAFLSGLGYVGSFFTRKSLLPLSEFDPSLHQKRDSQRFWDAPDYCNNFLFRPRG